MDVVGEDDRMNILRLADSAIHPQSWATIARGIYKGDGCFVEGINETQQAVVWCIPRLNLSLPPRKTGEKIIGQRPEDVPEGVGRREASKQGPQGKRVKRPEPRVFDPLEVARIFGNTAVSEHNGQYAFQKHVFRGGLVRRMVDVCDLSPEVRFSYSLYRACSLAPHIPQDRVEAFLWYHYGKSLEAGDRVKVIDGQQVGSVGCIVTITRNFAVIELDGANVSLEVHLKSLRRRIVIGDTVRVEVGVDQGKWGSVIEVSDDEVTILSPNAAQEVRLPSHRVIIC